MVAEQPEDPGGEFTVSNIPPARPREALPPRHVENLRGEVAEG